MQPPPEIAERLMRRVRPVLVDDDGGVPTGIRLMAARDLHLTLCFLGAFPAQRVDSLESALREELRGLDAPELTISGTGGFPDLQRPRVLWAGVDEDGATRGRLHAVHNRTVQAAYSMGWRPGGADRGRGLRPHLTVARVRRSEPTPPAPHPAFGRLAMGVNWVPAEVHLFESRPGCPEQRYPILASFPLIVRPG